MDNENPIKKLYKESKYLFIFSFLFYLLIAIIISCFKIIQDICEALINAFCGLNSRPSSPKEHNRDTFNEVIDYLSDKFKYLFALIILIIIISMIG